MKKQKKKGGERLRARSGERGVGGGVKHDLGKKAELGEAVIKNATNDKRERANARRSHGTDAGAEERRREGQTEGKKTTRSVPVSSSKGSTWLCLEAKSRVADSGVGWRLAAVPHCKAAVAPSRL